MVWHVKPRKLEWPESKAKSEEMIETLDQAIQLTDRHLSISKYQLAIVAASTVFFLLNGNSLGFWEKV